MRKIKYKKGRKLQPYNLEYTGVHKSHESEMQLFVYDNFDLSEYEDFKISDLDKYINSQKTNWLNIHGLNNLELMKSIGGHFNIDNFMLADILNTTKRTKLEELSDTLFFNIKSLLPAGDSDNISVEQISFLIKDGILISFQEKRSDFFIHIRERIRTHTGIVRTKKADYLLYILLDAIMQNFYITIENEEDKVEELINISKNSAEIEKVAKEVKKYNEHDHLDGIPEQTVRLYDKFRITVLNIADDIRIRPRKFYIGFVAKTNFTDVTVQNSKIKLFLNLKAGKLDDPKKLARDVSKTGHWGNGDYEISLSDDSNLEYIVSLVKQAYLKNKN